MSVGRSPDEDSPSWSCMHCASVALLRASIVAAPFNLLPTALPRQPPRKGILAITRCCRPASKPAYRHGKLSVAAVEALDGFALRL